MADIDGDEAPPRFNLVQDPWVSVRLADGDLAQLSLDQIFARLGEIRSLAGESPVQDAAVLRLLLAIAHSALGPSTERNHNPEFDGLDKPAFSEWAALWRDPARLCSACRAYLSEWSDRFELLDEHRPFYQVAGLSTGKEEVGPLVRLVLDVPNDEEKQYFTVRAGAGISSLTFAEAARWLVTVQAFDTSGIKSGVVGDPRTKGGKGYPIGPAWAAQLGLVYAEGDHLAETLLLNLVRGNTASGGWHSDDDVTANDIAPWEREDEQAIGVGVRAGTHEDLAPVEGVVDVLTWQARRALLQHSGGRVIGAIIANGDRANTDNGFAVETMTPWRQPLSGVGAKNAPIVLKPRRHAVEQAFWRGLRGVLPSLTGTHDSRGRAVRVPGVLRWSGALEAEGILPRTKRIGVRALGLKLDSNNAIVQDVYDDRLDLNALLVAESGEARRFTSAIAQEVEVTEQAVSALGRYAENLALAAGNRDTDVRSGALERGYFAVDAPFRSWIAEIRADMDAALLEEHQTAWRQRAIALVRRIGDELSDEFSDAVFVGRATSNGSRMDGGLAGIYFQRALNRALAVDASAVEGSSRSQDHRPQKGPHDDDAV